MNRSGTKRLGRFINLLLVFALVCMNCPGMGVQAAAKKKATKQPVPETATFRIISTTDLHGQVSTTHYDTASEKPGSLAQAYTLIKEARQEVGTRNTMTVDTGDSVYGYAADYILENSGEAAVQPIYKAMALVNYDAVALGNHDFDYGYSYIDKQLELSGLKSKCVVSNVIRADTGETAWNESKMIYKQLKTNKNQSLNLQVGIIGITIPSMSSYSNCKEDLVALPIVSTVEQQAASLKSKGADLVIVIAHSSFGSANPDADADNAVYALTKLKNVDAVAAGHGHKNYPSSDSTSAAYYNLPNVDKKTGLMNGKAVTMIKDHGAGIGLIDLELEVDDNGEIQLTNSAASLRMVTKDTPSSAVILDSQEPEITAVNQSLEDVVATFGNNERINSYFALLEDNYAIQLANEAKLQYGLAYTGGAGKGLYADCPVVATTKYTLSGSQSADDHISLDGSITMKDILNMQQDNHNNNIIYWVTGAQLRELLEWSASIYSTANGSISSDQVLERLLEERGASSIVAADWLEDWSAFAVFDGIEYTIDATRPARYTKTGEQQDANAHRIVSLTYNGQPITDDQKLILVSHTIANSDAAGTVPSQKVLGKTDLAYVHLVKFIKEQQEAGNLSVDTDDNWEVLFDTNRPYVVRSSVLSQQDAMVKQWFQGLLSSNETFAYYLAQFIQSAEAEKADTTRPLLVVASTVSDEMDQPVEIKVQANDSSGIAQLKWAPGQEALDSAAWTEASNVTRGCFLAEENGTYSVMAEDVFGNRTVKYIRVANINRDVVQAPTINKITNKGSALTGTARVGTTVHIDANGATYEAETLQDGTYTCTIERLPAGSTVSAYCTDAEGKQSKTVSITVLRNGPDTPVINGVANNSDKVTGYYTGTSAAVVAIIGSNVYLSAADKALYQKSEIYTKSRIVNTVNCSLTRNNFEMTLPIRNAGESVKFVTLDKAGRRSATLSATVADAAPNVPVIQEVCDAEDYLYGQATNISESGSVTVTVGNRTFTSEVQPDGTFAVQTNGFTAGETVWVSASDVKDGTARTSALASATVQSYQNYVTMADTRVQTIYNNSLEIKGDTLPNYEVNVVVRGRSSRVALDSLGQFTYTLTEPLQTGEKVYIVARSGGKIAEIAEQAVTEYVPAVITPETPSVLTSEITIYTQQLDVLAKEQGTVVMNIDGVDYTSQTGVYNQAYNGYIYSLPLPQTAVQQTITIRFISASGVSSGSVTVLRTSNV